MHKIQQGAGSRKGETSVEGTCPHCRRSGMLVEHTSAAERFDVCSGCGRSSGLRAKVWRWIKSPVWWVVRCDIGGGSSAYLAASRESKYQAVCTAERRKKAATFVSLREAQRQRDLWRRDAVVVRVRSVTP